MERLSVQRSSPWRQIAQGGDTSAFTKGRVVNPASPTEKVVKKVSGTDTKMVGRTAGQTVKTAEQGAKQALRSADGLKEAGGSVVVSVILVLCLVGVLVASPFGIFFADSSSPNTAAPSTAVAQINGELSDYLSALQTGGTYDRVEVLGQAPAWADVFAVFAAKTAGATDGMDVVTLDEARMDLLRVVFWDMTKITTEEKTVDHPASGSTPAWSETVLEITITPGRRMI